MPRLTRPATLVAHVRRKAGYLFIFAVTLLVFQVGFRGGRRHRETMPDNHVDARRPNERTTTTMMGTLSYGSDGSSITGQHPIPSLMQRAEEQFRQKLDGQSKTLEEAVAEYRRRYQRPPPKGFGQWWEFSRARDVKMTDEYDGVVDDLRPFFELPGEEIRRRSEQVGRLPSIDLVRIRNGIAKIVNVKSDFKDTEGSARANGFLDMLQGFLKTLPDMDFPINALAECRVLVPWEHRMYPNSTSQNSSAGIESLVGRFRADWADDGSVWEAWRRTCPPHTEARRLYSSLSPSFTLQPKNHLSPKKSAEFTDDDDDFSFADQTSAHTDWCAKPYAHNQQGHFFSDWRTIGALYPVFSPAKAKGFQDIRIPSHYYYGSTPRYTYGWDPVNLELKDMDPMEVPWDDKIDMVFWRGATTGGGSRPPGFAPQYHRHRFVRMASDATETKKRITFADPPASTTRWASTEVAVSELNDEILDAAFVNAVSVGSYPGGREALMRDHRFGDSVPLGAHWQYKYLADLDGMSYSGRFFAFLASDSVPVKATVYDEFYSDWIQPWLHFVPLSSSYREIYNVYAYFSGAPKSALEVLNSTLADLPPDERKSIEGDKRLRRIARAGKRWKQTIGRTVDLEVYVYRLCLEWARLWADDRDSMNYLE